MEYKKQSRRAKRRHTKYQRALFLDRLCMHSQDIHDMLGKPKSTPQTPLTASAWETYPRDHFHTRIESRWTSPHEAAARSEGNYPESAHDMGVRPSTGPEGNSPAGPHAAPPNILTTWF